jgi:hypothetical protein
VKPNRDPVLEFLDQYPRAVSDLARRLRSVIRSTLPDTREELDRRGRVVGYSYGPGYAGLVCTIILSKTAVKLGIVGGAKLPDPANLLEGVGKQHRYIAFTQASDFERPSIRDILHVAGTRWKERSRQKV